MNRKKQQGSGCKNKAKVVVKLERIKTRNDALTQQQQEEINARAIRARAAINASLFNTDVMSKDLLQLPYIKDLKCTFYSSSTTNDNNNNDNNNNNNNNVITNIIHEYRVIHDVDLILGQQYTFKSLNEIQHDTLFLSTDIKKLFINYYKSLNMDQRHMPIIISSLGKELKQHLEKVGESTTKVINKHYRKQSIKIHPDRHGETHRQEFQNLTDARDCLIDIKLRRLYIQQMLDVVRKVGVGLIQHSHNTWIEKNRPDLVTTKRRPTTTDQQETTQKPLQLMGGIGNDTPRMPQVEVICSKSKNVIISLHVLHPIYQFYEYCESLYVVGYCLEHNKEVTILKMNKDMILKQQQIHLSKDEGIEWLRLKVEMPWNSTGWSIKWYANLHMNGQGLQTPYSQEYEFELLSDKQMKLTRQKTELLKTEKVAIRRAGEIMAVLHKLDHNNVGTRSGGHSEEIDKRYNILHSVIVKGRSTERKLLTLMDAVNVKNDNNKATASSTAPPPSSSISNKGLQDLQDALEMTRTKKVELESIRNVQMKKNSLKSFKEYVATILESGSSPLWIESITENELKKHGGDSNRLYQLFIEGKGIFCLELDVDMLRNASKRTDLFTLKQCNVIQKRADDIEVEEELLLKKEEEIRIQKEKEEEQMKHDAHQSMIGKLVQIFGLQSSKNATTLNGLIGKVEGIVETTSSSGNKDNDKQQEGVQVIERYQVYIFNMKKTYSIKITNIKRFYGDVVLTNPVMNNNKNDNAPVSSSLQQQQQQDDDDQLQQQHQEQQQQEDHHHQLSSWYCSHCSYKNEGPNANNLTRCMICEQPRSCPSTKESWSGRQVATADEAVAPSSSPSLSSRTTSTASSTTTTASSITRDDVNVSVANNTATKQQQQPIHQQPPRISPPTGGVQAPDDMKAYVRKCLERCTTNEQKQWIEKEIEKMIAKAITDGILHTIDWNTLQLVTYQPQPQLSSSSLTSSNNGGALQNVQNVLLSKQQQQQKHGETTREKKQEKEEKRRQQQQQQIKGEASSTATTSTTAGSTIHFRQRTGEYHVSLDIQRSLIGIIIGTRGKNIAKIRSESGCANIYIDEKSKFRLAENMAIVKISDKDEKKVEAALQMVKSCLPQQQIPPPPPPTTITTTTTTTRTAIGDQRQQAPLPSSPPMNTDNQSLPSAPALINNVPIGHSSVSSNHITGPTLKSVLYNDYSSKAISSDRQTQDVRSGSPNFVAATSAQSKTTSSMMTMPQLPATPDVSQAVEKQSTGPDLVSMLNAAAGDDDHQKLLTFLQSQKSCLKGTPDDFCKWLDQSEDITTLADLVEALSDDDYIRESLQPGNGKVGLKGFKRAVFKKAAISALEIENNNNSANNKNLTETVSDMGDDNNKAVAPTELFCPISHELMIVDPVVAADECTYERSAIEDWFQTSKDRIARAQLDIVTNPRCERSQQILQQGITSPLRPTMKLPHLLLISNNNVRTMARDYARMLQQQTGV